MCSVGVFPGCPRRPRVPCAELGLSRPARSSRCGHAAPSWVQVKVPPSSCHSVLGNQCPATRVSQGEKHFWVRGEPAGPSNQTPALLFLLFAHGKGLWGWRARWSWCSPARQAPAPPAARGAAGEAAGCRLRSAWGQSVAPAGLHAFLSLHVPPETRFPA